MGALNPDNGSTDSGVQRVTYCIHGNTTGCCATILKDLTIPQKFSDVTSATIKIDDEHCHSNMQDVQVDNKARRKLIIASILCLIFMIAEIIGGYLSSSLAIATDAAHLLTDFASFMISLFAIWVAQRKPTRSMSFGWYRAEVIGALTSVLTIWVVTGILVYLAIERIIHRDFEIDAVIMLITSGIGVLVNIIMGLTLHQHGHTHGGAGHSHDHGEEQSSRRNINVRAAFIHVIGDFLQSFGVFVAAIVIYFYPQWNIVDPICTFLFSFLVLLTTIAIMKDTLIVLMEGIPKDVDFNRVMNTFMALDGVVKVHNLRIWALSMDKTALAAHLAIKKGVDSNDILKAASRKIHSKFNFFEMTLQIEVFDDNMENCKQCQWPEN
uniref:Zinc transporter 2 n=1 Tax=Clastoptera arizonana TaxID=38151 RepID=A0A1B6D8E9_9HEMI